MARPEVSYSSLSEANPFRNTAEEHNSPNDAEDTPRNSGLMIHSVPETGKARLNPIEDLDSFFTRIYNYHQKHGFSVIVMDEAFQLLEFGFVIWLLTFTVYCIKHPVLFGNVPPSENRTKVTLGDVVIPMGQCFGRISGLTSFFLIAATLYFIVRLIIMIYHITQYSDIKKFYNFVLHVRDNDLDNITWHEVKKKIRDVQAEQHMCIGKEQLTELDIYHRILRFENYMVALMNKNLLPVRYNIPLIGEIVSLSCGLLYNIEIILFRGWGSPFKNNWQLRDDYTVRSNQVELAQRLSNKILWLAIANLIMAPAIFIWQLIYFLFAYANILRKEPGALGIRTWSNYGRLYLRHFNELDHELDARLNRAYEHADKYLSSFSSPTMTVVAKNILFISGGLLVLLLALGIYEEHVFQVEHVLTIITVLSAVGLVCRTLIPDEHLIWCPEKLMTAVLAHTHYLPSEWKHQAHTAVVRNEFGHFFQYKASYILNEVCSPLVTPFILLFVFRPKAVEIVKFFRSFTVTVKGVGDVCSFAQMDVRKYGNPDWQLQLHEGAATKTIHGNVDDKLMRYPVENGKTELSLLRFTLTNPEWRMPPDALNFLRGIRQNAVQDLLKAKTANKKVGQNAMTGSLLSFGTIGEEYYSIAHSVLNARNIFGNQTQQQQGTQVDIAACSNQGSDFEQMLQQNLGDQSHVSQSIQQLPLRSDQLLASQILLSSMNSMDKSMRKMRVSKIEGRLEGPTEALIYNIYSMDPKLTTNTTNVTVADMCLSTLYLHELHRRNQKLKKTYSLETGPIARGHSVITTKAAENTPLLGGIPQS